MISVEYYRHFIEKHCCDERFVRMAQALGMKDAKAPEDFITALKKLQEDCGVSDLKMSDYGIEKEESMVLALSLIHIFRGKRLSGGSLYQERGSNSSDEPRYARDGCGCEPAELYRVSGAVKTHGYGVRV